LKTYCVYVLERFEGAFIAFYVGISCNPPGRLKAHRNERLNNHKSNLIRKVIRSIGYLPMQIVATGLTKDEAKRLEVKLIAAFRQHGISITNRTPGGDLQDPPTPETRAKISAALTGIKRSPETRARMGAAMKGRKLSPAHIAKLKVAHSGRKLPPDTVAKMKGRTPWNKGLKSSQVAWNKGLKQSPELIAKLSVLRKGRTPWNKGLKSSQVAWNKGGKLSLEHCAKLKIAWIGRRNRAALDSAASQQMDQPQWQQM
jgi:predicted GIY-YIG superfamily endonuclease